MRRVVLLVPSPRCRAAAPHRPGHRLVGGNSAVRRHRHPLRHPAARGWLAAGLMEADDFGTYMVKRQAAGQGANVLVPEVVCAELARVLGLRCRGW